MLNLLMSTPNTGDSSQPWLFAAIFAVAAVLVAAYIILGKKSKK